VLGLITALFLIPVALNLRNDMPFFSILSHYRWPLLVLLPLVITACVYAAFLIGRAFPIVFQFGKFITIGASNTAIDLGILNILLLVTGFHKGVFYTIFKAFSFIVAMINSYFWNKFWTFNDTERCGMGRQFLSFLLVSGVGFGIDVFIATFIVNFVEPLAGATHDVWANIGAIIAFATTVLWNFLGYKFFVFRS
jgi:putative flippase GtrA